MSIIFPRLQTCWPMALLMRRRYPMAACSANVSTKRAQPKHIVVPRRFKSNRNHYIHARFWVITKLPYHMIQSVPRRSLRGITGCPCKSHFLPYCTSTTGSSNKKKVDTPIEVESPPLSEAETGYQKLVLRKQRTTIRQRWNEAITRLKEKKVQFVLEYGSTFIFLHELLGISSYLIVFSLIHFNVINIDTILSMFGWNESMLLEKYGIDVHGTFTKWALTVVTVKVCNF